MPWAPQLLLQEQPAQSKIERIDEGDGEGQRQPVRAVSKTAAVSVVAVSVVAVSVETVKLGAPGGPDCSVKS